MRKNWGSSSLIDRYSRPSLDIFFHAAPHSTIWSAKMRFGQQIMLVGFFHREPCEIAAMSHVAIRPEFRSLIRRSLPVQQCQYCAEAAEPSEAAGAIGKSWMQGWRITCRVCGNPLVDTAASRQLGMQSGHFAEHWETACAGEQFFESRTSSSSNLGPSPMTVLRLLMLPRWPHPHEMWSGYRQSRLLNVVLPGFDDLVHTLKLKPALFRNFFLPVDLRVPLLAGVAVVMRNPGNMISKLRDNTRSHDRRRFADIETETQNGTESTSS